jgi:ABC-type bacteriocin/lantibiotic exporter with double-glycine peptidase domain
MIQQKILPTIIVSVMIGILGLFMFIFVSKLVGIGFIFVAGLIATVASKTIKVKKETFDDNKKELGF